MAKYIFNEEERAALDAGERWFADITKDELIGLISALGNYFGSWIEEAPGSTLESPTLRNDAHRRLSLNAFKPSRNRQSTNHQVFDEKEQRHVGSTGYECITKNELVQLLTALGEYSSLAEPLDFTTIHTGTVRMITAHNALLDFRNQRFKRREFHEKLCNAHDIESYAYWLLNLSSIIGISIVIVSKLEILTKEIIHLYKKHSMKRTDLEKYLVSSKKGSEFLLNCLNQEYKKYRMERTDLEKYLVSSKKDSEFLLNCLNQATKYSNSPKKNTELNIKNFTKEPAIIKFLEYSELELSTAIDINVSAASNLETSTKKITQLYEEHKMTRTDLEKYLNSVQEISKNILEILEKADNFLYNSKQAVAKEKWSRLELNLAN